MSYTREEVGRDGTLRSLAKLDGTSLNMPMVEARDFRFEPRVVGVLSERVMLPSASHERPRHQPPRTGLRSTPC